jgi:hypothetical protein
MTARPQLLFSRPLGQGSQFADLEYDGDEDMLRRYGSIAAEYEEAFRQLGIEYVCLEAPSIYQTEESLSVLGVTSSTPHIAVRPISDFRPVHGLANYIVFAGPASELDGAVRNSLRPAIDILRLARGVLCTSSILTNALAARGLTNASTLRPAQRTEDLDAFGARLRTEIFKL